MKFWNKQKNNIKQITLNKEQLCMQQAVLLELLCEVRRICELLDIHYAIIAGTMLGAVRHGGFIPWDDDADVAMFREDYEAFREACGRYLDTARFYFQDHVCTEGYRWGYGKLRRRDSRYVVRGTEKMPYEQGIWIDIFPLDHVPDYWVGRVFCNFHCFCIRKLLYAESGKHRGKNWLEQSICKGMSRIPLSMILTHYEKYVEKRNKERTEWVRILTFPTPNHKYGYLCRWYQDTSNIAFEGEIFAGIRDYESYLTFKFGNYLEIPPLDKRRQHHISELKFPG